MTKSGIKQLSFLTSIKLLENEIHASSSKLGIEKLNFYQIKKENKDLKANHSSKGQNSQAMHTTFSKIYRFCLGSWLRSEIAINGDTDNCLAKKNGFLHTKSTRKHSIYILARPCGSSLLEQKYQICAQIWKPTKYTRICCIKDFWCLIKGEVYKEVCKAEKLDQWRTRILNCFKKADQEWESTRSEDKVL